MFSNIYILLKIFFSSLLQYEFSIIKNRGDVSLKSFNPTRLVNLSSSRHPKQLHSSRAQLHSARERFNTRRFSNFEKDETNQFVCVNNEITKIFVCVRVYLFKKKVIFIFIWIHFSVIGKHCTNLFRFSYIYIFV